MNCPECRKEVAIGNLFCTWCERFIPNPAVGTKRYRADDPESIGERRWSRAKPWSLSVLYPVREST